MCGRYALILPPEAVRSFFGFSEQPNFPPRYNIAPTQPVPVVVAAAARRQFALMRWGFVPGWVKDLKDFPLVINVRAETAAEKPSFRAALSRRRCLMPADGFYEWARIDGENRAFLFRRPDRGVFAFAAIHETWSSPDGSEIDTVALLNTHANALMARIHPRCPVILEQRDFDRWLDPANAARDVTALLQPPPDEALEMIRIGTAVNKVANDGPPLQDPWQPEAPPPPKAARAPAPRRKAGDGGQGSLF